jgi:hypothetical protein
MFFTHISNIAQKLKPMASKLFLAETGIVSFSLLVEKSYGGNGQYYFGRNW